MVPQSYAQSKSESRVNEFVYAAQLLGSSLELDSQFQQRHSDVPFVGVFS
jgi:hypothetical protein